VWTQRWQSSIKKIIIPHWYTKSCHDTKLWHQVISWHDLDDVISQQQPIAQGTPQALPLDPLWMELQPDPGSLWSRCPQCPPHRVWDSSLHGETNAGSRGDCPMFQEWPKMVAAPQTNTFRPPEAEKLERNEQPLAPDSHLWSQLYPPTPAQRSSEWFMCPKESPLLQGIAYFAPKKSAAQNSENISNKHILVRGVTLCRLVFKF